MGGENHPEDRENDVGSAVVQWQVEEIALTEVDVHPLCPRPLACDFKWPWSSVDPDHPRAAHRGKQRGISSPTCQVDDLVSWRQRRHLHNGLRHQLELRRRPLVLARSQSTTARS